MERREDDVVWCVSRLGGITCGRLCVSLVGSGGCVLWGARMEPWKVFAADNWRAEWVGFERGIVASGVGLF